MEKQVILANLRGAGIHVPAPWSERRADQIVEHLSGSPFKVGHVGQGGAPTAHSSDLDVILTAPHCFESALSWLAVAEAYFDGPGWLYSLNAFWLDGQHVVHNWHRDEDAEKQLAVFMFLTDTDENGGGHEYQTGTHNIRRNQDLKHHHFEPPAEIVRRVYGKRGTVFIEDPWGLHRALPSDRPRALLWARYAATDNPGGYVPKEPLPASVLGERYPSDEPTREAIKLLVK